MVYIVYRQCWIDSHSFTAEPRDADRMVVPAVAVTVGGCEWVCVQGWRCCECCLRKVSDGGGVTKEDGA